MELLFDRRCRVVVHRLVLTDLRMAFRVERSVTREPNVAEVRIWNLNREHQRALQGQSIVPVRIEAGYAQQGLSADTEALLTDIGLEKKADLPVLFQGDLRKAHSTREGPDWVTTISSGDGEKASQKQRVKLSFRPNLRLRAIITKLAQSAGVGIGNALNALHDLGDLEISSGLSINGSALGKLDELLRGAGFEYSVQNGELQVLRPGESLRGSAALVSEATGLVDSPEPTNDGTIFFRTLLQPGLDPGRSIELRSDRVSGFYRVERVRYVGDTHALDWYAEVEVKEL